MSHNNSHIHEDWPDEHPKNHFGQKISIIVFLLTWATDSFILKLTTGLENVVPLAARIILCIICIFIGILLFKSVFKIFDDMGSTHKILMTGPFRYMRHPLYTGVLLFYLGLICFSLSIVSVIIFVFVFMFYNKMAAYEEEKLIIKHGEDYLDYKNNVSKWFPKVFKNFL